MWNFITDNNTSIVPSTLLDSALSIENFDDDFDEDEDDDFEARSYSHNQNEGDDDDDDDTTRRQQRHENSEAVQMTEEEKANEESFANLPAGTGVYRVQYAFAAEAPQEMDVREGGEPPFSLSVKNECVLTCLSSL